MIKYLILDLETDSFDVNKANVRIFGMYDLEADKYIITSNESKALEIIKNTEFIIGYNIKEYDLPILYNRYGLKISYDKYIDLYQIFKKRQSVITSKPFSNFKLKTIAKELGLDDEGGKGTIDYNIFKRLPSQWTQEEKVQIEKYTKQDLLLTSKCFKFLRDKFEPFKEFMKQGDIDNLKHVNASMGAYSYKVICHLCNLKEEYDFDTEHQRYVGAFVQIPKKEFVRGKVLCFDYSSLYPFMFIQANLFSHHCNCCKDEEKWDGGGFFKVKGRYCRKQQGKIETILKDFYLKRKEYKKVKDQREQVMKIVLNSIYGISGSPIFSRLYNLNTASDCTSLGQQCIKFGISTFEKAGYTCLYSDTDSLYIEVPEGKTEEECMEISNNIAKTLSKQFPFGWDEFNLKLECNIRFINFFREELGDFKKKHYIYVTEDGKLVVKGIVIVKKDCSQLSRFIFEKYIKDNIIKESRCKYTKKQITEWIYNELLQNREIASKQFSIKEQSDYKNTTSIQSMICAKYGSGEHRLIKNLKIGIGKGIKYCSIEEARNLSIGDFDIEIFLRELSPFIKQDVQNTLF